MKLKPEFENAKVRVFQQASHLFSRVWWPRLFEEIAKGDSPPEELMAVVLEVLLWEEIRSGRISLVRQAEFTTSTGHTIRADFALVQKATNARIVIECDGYSYHRRTSAEFEKEIQRERELIKQDVRVVRFAASELFQDPWRAGAELIEMFNSWTEAQGIDLPDELLQELGFVNAVQEDLGQQIVPPTRTVDPDFLRLITDQIGEWTHERTGDKLEPKHVEVRREFARAYEPWSEEEEALLRLALQHCRDVSQLSTVFQRQPSALKSHLQRLGIVPKLAQLDKHVQTREPILEEIKNIILNSKTLLSDREIKDLLHEKGHEIARRTVSKYRDMLQLESSAKKKSKGNEP